MEMIPIPQRRRQTLAEEPLLDVFEDEWLLFDEQRRRRRRGRRRPCGHVLSAPSNYQAPIFAGLKSPAQQDDPYGLPNLDPSVRGQSLIHHIHHNLLHQTNPAQDLAMTWISHGSLCCQCVRTQEIGITESFGKFDALLEPGLHIMCWPYSTIATHISLRIRQLDIVCETKTMDNVFVHIQISVQYRVIPEMAYNAHYRLTDPTLQIRSYVYDVIRSQVPRMDLEEVFLSKHKIAKEVDTRLHYDMKDFGHEIVHSLCTNVFPTAQVKQAMNEVEACRREKLATPYRAETQKILCITQAEARAECCYLQGVGTAHMRNSIVAGLKETAQGSMDHNMDFSQVVHILLLSQYTEILTQVGTNKLILKAAPDEVTRMKDGLAYSS